MPGAELRRDSSDRRGRTLNSTLGVASEAFNASAEVLLLPSLILAFFVAELTPSYATIGLVPAIATGFWTLGRLPAYMLTGARRRQQPWAFAAALVRVAAVAILAVVTSRTDPAALTQSARPLILTFFLCLIVYSLAGGFGSLPGAALLRSSIPSESWGAFVRHRAAWAAGVCLFTALVAARVLGMNGSTFPSSYGRLFLVATVCLIAVAVFTAAVEGTMDPAGALGDESISAFVAPAVVRLSIPAISPVSNRPFGDCRDRSISRSLRGYSSRRSNHRDWRLCTERGIRLGLVRSDMVLDRAPGRRP